MYADDAKCRLPPLISNSMPQAGMRFSRPRMVRASRTTSTPLLSMSCPKKPKRLDETAVLRAVEFRRRVDLAVRDDDAFFRGEAPVEVALGQELRRKDELVAFFQKRLQPPCAERNGFRPHVRKALVAVYRRGRVAQFSGVALDHLPVGHTDRHHLMEGQADSRVRSRDTGGADRLYADPVVVVEMDNVRVDPFHELAEKLHRTPVCDRKLAKVVKLGEKEILSRLARHRNDRSAELAVDQLPFGFERANQIGVVSLREAGSKQFVRDLLFAAGRHGRVIVRDKQNSHHRSGGRRRALLKTRRLWSRWPPPARPSLVRVRARTDND